MGLAGRHRIAADAIERWMVEYSAVAGQMINPLHRFTRPFIRSLHENRAFLKVVSVESRDIRDAGG